MENNVVEWIKKNLKKITVTTPLGQASLKLPKTKIEVRTVVKQ